jgi:hypothetical protein
MNLTDYLVDSALILIVFRQLKEKKMDLHFVLLPLVLVGIAAHAYLHSIPTDGNDLVLISAFAAVGLVFGLGSALATRVRYAGGQHALAQAGFVSAGLWIVSMSLRMGFQIYASHGGQDSIARFSMSHQITTANAWTAALVLMAVAEVVTRTGTLMIRNRRAVTAPRPVAVPVSV